ncbi:MAG: dTDP-4-dehydrorhamnose reductase [Clostridiales Family XIII bacterium]|nr:dTDP-4-dehydrorhamnose reductase [Clostridiales Family XIII bacterium]
MNILIIGDKGQLGNELKDILASGRSEIGAIPEVYAGAVVTGVDIDGLDISDEDAVRGYFEGSVPIGGRAYDVIINCAAMTNVDACETDEEAAMKANALGPRNIAAAAAAHGAKLVHISTDYVFPGDASAPYREWDQPAPTTVYGKSKLLGERHAMQQNRKTFIVRTAWLYGYVGNNFVKTILGLAKDRESIKVVDDQIGNPTHANDLAHHLLKIALTDEYGVYHCTGNGVCSWYDFASEIVRLADLDCNVEPCTTEEFPRPAPRPAYSAMDHLMLRCTVGDEMREWERALAGYIQRTGKLS